MGLQIKRKIYKYKSSVRCRLNKLPANCIVEDKVKINSSVFDGRNKIDAGSRIINSHIGFGTYIAPESNIINCNIGRYSMVGFRALVGAHPIHKYVSLHPALYSNAGQYGFTYASETTFDEYKKIYDNWSIIIGNDVWVTAISDIVQGVTIGDGAVILAGAVVTKDIPPYAIAGGIPAKVVGYRFEQEDIDFLLKLQWWNKDEKWIIEHREYFDDVKLLKEHIMCEDKMSEGNL